MRLQISPPVGISSCEEPPTTLLYDTAHSKYNLQHIHYLWNYSTYSQRLSVTLMYWRYSLSLSLSLLDASPFYRPFERIRQAAELVVADLSDRPQTATASESAPSKLLLLPTAAQEELGGEGGEEAGAGAGGAGYVARLKTAVLDCVDTAKRAPETFEEALAVVKGERAVKPDYGRAVSTVSAVR